jgi:hypothetical protein
MKAASPLREPIPVGLLLRQRLTEIDRSPKELADAVQVPVAYIDDLIAGRRRPPLPNRTDVYDRMTSFLRLSRNDLAVCARSERSDAEAAPVAVKPSVRRALVALCDPDTAAMLEERRVKLGGAEILSLIARLLHLTQGTVCRVLAEPITLQLAAERSGDTLEDTRLRVLEFLDATTDTLTTDHVKEFVHPYVERWDVDVGTGVLRVVLRGRAPRKGGRARV